MTEGPGSTPDPHQRPESWTTPDPSGSQPGQPPGQYPPGQPPGQPPGEYPPGQQPGPYPQGPYQGGPYQPGQYPQGPYPPGYRPPAPRPGIIPLRPLGLGDILDGTVKLIRSHPKVTLGLSAIVGVVVAVPEAVYQAVSLGDLAGGVTDPATLQGQPTDVGDVASQAIGTGLSVLLTFLATTLLTGLLTRVLGRAVFGGRITAGEAWRMTRSRVWALLGQALLVLVLLLLPAALVGALFVAGIGLDVTALTVVAGICVLPWMIYAAFLGTRLALAPAALVLEHLGVVDSMRRSWDLVKGDSWRVFGIILLTQILIGIVSSVASAPFTIGSVMLLTLGPGSAAVATGAAILIALGQTLTATLTYPFTAGVYGLLYTDRRMRAEAFDLTLQTAATRPGAVPVDDLWQPTPADSTRP